MIVTYRRVGGIQPPPDRELLTIDDDGSFTLWRSVGWATYPPTPVGRFSGRLDSADVSTLQEEASSARTGGNVHLISMPGSAIEDIQISGAHGEIATHDTPDGPWAGLVAHVRQLLGDLTAHPRAAISLQVDPAGESARLVHLGSDALRIDLTALTVQAQLWRPADYGIVRTWNAAQVPALGVTTASPGWTFDLPFDHCFDVVEGTSVKAFVTCTLFDDATPTLISLESPPPVDG